jgi:rubrerythrin
MHTYSVDAIMQKAIEVEKAGAEFYRKLSTEVSISAVKDVFLKLLTDEIEHQKNFADMGRAMKGVVIESPLDILEIMSQSMTALRSAMKGSQLVTMGEINLSQAINIGIHNEQEAIKVYSSLLGIKHPDFNAIMKKVIAEEQAHLKMLEDMKRSRLS